VLKPFADYLVFDLFGLSPGTHLGEALNFFVYDTLKIFFLLTVIIFAVAIVRSWFPPEKTKRILSHEREYVGNVMAALLGIVTPFCSCSAVPLFIGFVESGVPLGVTFSFLISSPMVNEVALIMLWGMFGWRIALIYIGTGLLVAIVAGIVIGPLKMEKYVQITLEMQVEMEKSPCKAGRSGSPMPGSNSGTPEEDLPAVVVVIGNRRLLHGYVPQDFLARWAGRDNPFAVPVAVALGVPLYSNAAGVIPIVQALTAKGMAMGTVLAFMMAVTALSLPEAIILKNVLKNRLLAVFFGTVAVAIVIVGYLFNAIL